MRKWLAAAALLVTVGACDTRPEPAAPDRARALTLGLGPGAGVFDPALSAALTSAAPTDSLVVIVNYDEAATTRDAVTNAILGLGAGVIQFTHLELVAALATPAQIMAIAGFDGIRSIYLNRQLRYDGLPNSETSIGHGTHVSGIAAGLGTASGGYYTGVAPGAKLVGIGAGDVLFVFWILAGFDYILDHQQDYDIKVVNNSWGSSGAFDPNDPINKATKTVHDHGITVVFAAGNDGPDENTLNPYSVAPWVIGVAAGCKLVSPDPTNSAIHCDDPTGQNRPPWLADFSSRGIPDDPLYHPAITAPGVHIVSTRASTGLVLNATDAPHDFDLTSTCALSLPYALDYTCAS